VTSKRRIWVPFTVFTTVTAVSAFAACSAPDVEQPSFDAGSTSDAKAAPPSNDAQTAHDAGADGAADPCASDAGLPGALACTGLYSDWDTKTIAKDAHYYEPGFTLWSDGALKRRWIQLPPHTQIDTANMDAWVFPVGTKIWKEFSLGGHIDDGGELVDAKRTETRLLYKEAEGKWSSAVYQWSGDQLSASRAAQGKLVPQPNGGPDYEIPSENACVGCHAGSNDFVLGFELVGLGVSGAGATGGLTLATLPPDWLTQPPPAMTVTIPDDASKKAPAALGMLHMNCGVSCHNSGGGKAGYTGLYMKLLASQLFPSSGTANVTSLDTYKTAVSVQGHLALGKYMRIAPGSSAESLVTLMAHARKPDAGVFLPMPPVLTHRPDLDPARGLPAVEAWIDGL
jgi:hypothetical protein